MLSLGRKLGEGRSIDFQHVAGLTMINILIVDHGAGALLSLRKLMSPNDASGLNIDFTNDYRDVLEGFRSKDYDVCVIDSATGNGLGLFHQVRSLGCDAPIVLVTSNDAAEALNAIRCGVADCLVRDEMTVASVERLICTVAEQERVFTQQSERELRYLALVDNADELIFTHDLTGRFTSLNLTAQQLMGYAQEEWLSLRLPEVVGPDYRNEVAEMIRLTLDSRHQMSGAFDFVTKQGKTISIEARTHLIYQLGRVVEIQWIARDLSVSSPPIPLKRNTHSHGSLPGEMSQSNDRVIFIA